MSRQIAAIVGPTASGKTDLSIVLAQRFNGEVVSADSMQIYRGMDIGTAKPTPAERQGIAHHMLDVACPGEDWSVSRYEQEASRCIEDILARGKLPILCGGTGLYIDAVIRGTGFQAGQQSGEERKKLERQWDELGAAEMHRKLRAVDPESAERLHPNDKRRVIRALEVYSLTGVPISEHNRRTRLRPPRFDALMIGLRPVPREALYARIDARVGRMEKEGLVQEARALYESGALSGTAAQAIGYKELIDYFEGRCTLPEALDTIRRKSRNYAKRQLTWFQSDDRIYWIPVHTPASADAVAEEATTFLRQAGLQ